MAPNISEKVMWAAREAGLTRAESRLLGAYVKCDGVRAAAHELGIAEQTASNQSLRLRRRLDVPHLAAAVALVLTNNNY